MGASKKMQAKPVGPKTETKKETIASHKKKVASAIEFKRLNKEKSKHEKTQKIDRQKKDDIRKFQEDEDVDAEGYFILPEKVKKFLSYSKKNTKNPLSIQFHFF